VPGEAVTDLVADPTEAADSSQPVNFVKPPSQTLKQKRQDPFEGFGYDPDEIAAYYSRRPVQVGTAPFRVFCCPLSRFISQPLVRQAGRKRSTRKNSRRRAVKLREILTDLGPAYIKIGQALSTRPDLVPPIYLRRTHTTSRPAAPFL
jgi:hypothetical protein